MEAFCATTTGKNFGGNVLYFAGPLVTTAAYQQVKNGAFGTPAGWRSQDTWQIGASYDFTLVKLFGQYSRVKTNAAQDTETKLTSVGVSVPIGLGKVLLQHRHPTAVLAPDPCRQRCLHAHAADPQRPPAGDEGRPAA